jgi:uncharacterized protein YciI
MPRWNRARLGRGAALACSAALAALTACTSPAPTNAYDPALAASVGADERGMRGYVFVLLRSGPQPMPPGPARDEMFKGHMANIGRLAREGSLVLAGPFDGVDGWRGMFIFAVDTIDEARALVATDPVIAEGEMVAEYHRYYGTAALMLLKDAQARVARDPIVRP